MKIHDLVSIDEEAEFRNDVQLSHFEDLEANLALLRSYIFTQTVPGDQESTVSLLRIATEVFSNGRLENRIAVVANYGHGKSHLALVLANYFGRAYPSPELNIILEKLSNAINNAAQVARYREFRQSHPEYLVVRLRGDVPYTLREQFVSGLELALKEHAATQNAKVPHWYQGAEQFLVSLKGENLAKANRHLEKAGSEVTLLLADVRQRRDAAYDQVRDLSSELFGFPLEFGAQVSMAMLVNWAVKTYCGEGKPLGGILVLFDEFSLYVMNYAQRNAAGELQDLLNGIESNKGSALFMAFAQRDPVELGRHLANTIQGETLQKELTRIPKRVTLYSLMESVVDSYLKQPEAAWREFRSVTANRGPLARASNLAMEVFRQRYDQTLRWEPEKFDEIVTKGCFPLHPITTALLCDMKLQAVQAAGNPRTVLGFVLERITEKQNQAAATPAGKINWVLPIGLVDYFLEYLPEDAIRLYNEADRHLPGDASAEQAALLKALLLQTAARLPARRDNQKEFLAEASGIELAEASQQLRALSENKIIRWDATTHLYSFWPISSNPHRLDEILAKHITRPDLTWDLIEDLQAELSGIAVDVPWGHPDDWQASQFVLSRAFFDVPHLRELIAPYRVTAGGEVGEEDHGCVVWLLALADDDIAWFGQKAPAVLDEAFPGDNPLPVVLMLPSKPVSDLVQALQRAEILQNLGQDDRKEVGDAYEQEVKRQQLVIAAGLGVLRNDALNYASLPRQVSTWVVPAAYRAPLQALGRSSLQKLLAEVYKLAYRYSPPEFFTQFKAGGKGPNALRTAVRMLSGLLLRNTLANNRQGINASPVARDLTEKILHNSWHVLTADMRIQEPGNQRLAQAWKLLDETFGAGRQDIPFAPVVAQLLNPPYGYDLNTLALLFSAWVGYNVQDLQISLNGRQTAWEAIAESLNDNKAQLITGILTQHGRISRRDQANVEREIKATINKVMRETHTQVDALRMVASLQAYLADSGPAAPSAAPAKEAVDHLSLMLEAAQTYDRMARDIQDELGREKSALAMIGIGARIQNLPKFGNVMPKEARSDSLQAKWLASLETQVGETCRNLETIERVAQLDRNKENLEELKKKLRGAGLAELAKEVDKSLRNLSKHGQELETEGKEAPIRAEIQAMNTRVGLADLYSFQTRLKQFSDIAEPTKQLRDRKLTEINGAVNQAETFAKGLLIAAPDLSNLDDANGWLEKYQRAHQQYQDTPFYIDLFASGERVTLLRQFLTTLDALSKRKPRSPDEAEAIRQQLAELDVTAESLGGTATGLLDQARQQLGQQVSEALAQAKEWLNKFEYELKDSPSLKSIRDHLQFPPQYMSGDDQARWKKLRSMAQSRLDDDVVTRIESQFRDIKDVSVRVACVQRLQEILKEESTR